MPAVLSPDLRISNSDLVICSYQVQTFSLIFVCSDLNRFTTSRSQNGKAISKYLIQKRHRENRTSCWPVRGHYIVVFSTIFVATGTHVVYILNITNVVTFSTLKRRYACVLWYFLEYLFPVTEMICGYTNFKSNCYAPMLYKYNHFF